MALPMTATTGTSMYRVHRQRTRRHPRPRPSPRQPAPPPPPPPPLSWPPLPPLPARMCCSAAGARPCYTAPYPHQSEIGVNRKPWRNPAGTSTVAHPGAAAGHLQTREARVYRARLLQIQDPRNWMRATGRGRRILCAKRCRWGSPWRRRGPRTRATTRRTSQEGL